MKSPIRPRGEQPEYARTETVAKFHIHGATNDIMPDGSTAGSGRGRYHRRRLRLYGQSNRTSMRELIITVHE